VGVNKEDKEQSVIQQLNEIVNGEGNDRASDKSNFVRWYCQPKEDREKDIKNWEQVSKSKFHGKQLDTVLEWRFETNVQKGIKFWKKLLLVDDILNIYESMLDKALGGDVQAANWIRAFKDDKFFNDGESEFEKLMRSAKLYGNEEDFNE
jgi:hypothetical protein